MYSYVALLGADEFAKTACSLSSESLECENKGKVVKNKRGFKIPSPETFKRPFPMLFNNNF